MPKIIKVKFTPFDGSPKVYTGVKPACEELGLNYHTVKMKFLRQDQAGKDRVHIWEGGKIEVL